MTLNNHVAYFFNDDIGKFYYYKDHPMKPRRIAMTNSLVQSFDLYRYMDVYRNRPATKQQLTRFHHPQYINYLQNYICRQVLTSQGFMSTNNNMIQQQQRKYLIQNNKKKSQFSMNETGDCPGFTGLYEFCQLSCGGTIDASHLLLSQNNNIVINWGGGLHHAKKCQASGFCYTNDIVLGILELLTIHTRILYVDVDVHHGDGVQQAFYLTDRVMTVSFHQYGQEFFPGTGNIDSIGEGKGKYYSLNIPLKIGIDDQNYHELFKVIMDEVILRYKPGAIVLQLGADSLAYDLLGRLNLSLHGHGECVKKMMSYGLPMMLLGGGGYTVQNVSRCWLYQTGLVLGEQIDGFIPKTDRFYQAYSPDNRLHFIVKATKNKNTEALQHLKLLQCNPGVPFHQVPTMAFTKNSQIDQDDENNNERSLNLLNKRQKCGDL